MKTVYHLILFSILASGSFAFADGPPDNPGADATVRPDGSMAISCATGTCTRANEPTLLMAGKGVSGSNIVPTGKPAAVAPVGAESVR